MYADVALLHGPHEMSQKTKENLGLNADVGEVVAVRQQNRGATIAAVHKDTRWHPSADELDDPEG